MVLPCSTRVGLADLDVSKRAQWAKPALTCIIKISWQDMFVFLCRLPSSYNIAILGGEFSDRSMGESNFIVFPGRILILLSVTEYKY